MPSPNGLVSLIVWIVVVVVICIAAVFLFQNIVLPLIRTLT